MAITLQKVTFLKDIIKVKKFLKLHTVSYITIEMEQSGRQTARRTVRQTQTTNHKTFGKVK